MEEIGCSEHILFGQQWKFWDCWISMHESVACLYSQIGTPLRGNQFALWHLLPASVLTVHHEMLTLPLSETSHQLTCPCHTAILILARSLLEASLRLSPQSSHAHNVWSLLSMTPTSIVPFICMVPFQSTGPYIPSLASQCSFYLPILTTTWFLSWGHLLRCGPLQRKKLICSSLFFTSPSIP